MMGSRSCQTIAPCGYGSLRSQGRQRAGTTASHHLLRDNHVVHVSVGGEAPFVGKGIVDHAGLLGDDEAAVEQSILGRMLNYGDVTINGVGEGRQVIPTIASPLAFRSAITTK